MIRANYSENTIRIYQAYNDKIADEAVKLGTFGLLFKRERMTWIKPSFLWMMYRSGWATKENQERILAIDITQEGFNEILSEAVLSSYHGEVYGSREIWSERLQNSNVRCQWDPERDIHGNPQDLRAIQLGIKGDVVSKYLDEWIVNIEDITPFVLSCREEIKSGTFDLARLPGESEYPCDDSIEIMKVFSSIVVNG